jgi:hypothetical protein
MEQEKEKRKRWKGRAEGKCKWRCGCSPACVSAAEVRCTRWLREERKSSERACCELLSE